MVRALVRQGVSPDHAERIVEAQCEPQRESTAEERPTTEHEEQVALFQWAEEQTWRYPELALIYAIPNFHGRLGNLTAKHGADLKAEGRKRGVPDICLPVARGAFHGLYIELKTLTGKPSDVQLEWQAQLRAQKYRAEIAKGWTAARDLITNYLDG